MRKMIAAAAAMMLVLPGMVVFGTPSAAQNTDLSGKIDIGMVANPQMVALQEMVTNILRHAYELDHDRPVEVAFVASAESFEVTLRDQGPPFDPLSRPPEPVTEASGMPEQPGGFGIHIVRQIMDELSYTRRDGWNELRMKKFAQTPSVVQ